MVGQCDSLPARADRQAAQLAGQLGMCVVLSQVCPTGGVPSALIMAGHVQMYSSKLTGLGPAYCAHSKSFFQQFFRLVRTDNIEYAALADWTCTAAFHRVKRLSKDAMSSGALHITAMVMQLAHVAAPADFFGTYYRVIQQYVSGKQRLAGLRLQITGCPTHGTQIRPAAWMCRAPAKHSAIPVCKSTCRPAHLSHHLATSMPLVAHVCCSIHVMHGLCTGGHLALQAPGMQPCCL